jgi:exopolyphosphatase/guanosine-5'-triphosphate,3'-diphosphate pyrophosphatase
VTGDAPVAAIDVGTNTTRLLVARAIDGRIQPLASGSAMTALGAGLTPGGDIGREGLDLVSATVRQMAAVARRLGAVRLVVATTAPGRTARNAAVLLAHLEAAAGVPARVLSGTEEAALAFRGMVAWGAPHPQQAVDQGGGSLELMGGEGGALRWATSIPVGVRTLSERFRPPDPPPLDLLEPIVGAVRELLDAVDVPVGGTEALAAGGSAEALAVLAGSERLDREGLLRAVERLAAAPAADLAEATGIEPRRLRLCMAGAAAFEAVRRSFRIDVLHVSHAGIREGLVLEATA